MAEGYKWTIRNVDPHLIVRLRVLALLRGVPLSVVTNEAIAGYLEREEESRETTEAAGHREVDEPPSA